jgi:hypothetical protein
MESRGRERKGGRDREENLRKKKKKLWLFKQSILPKLVKQKVHLTGVTSWVFLSVRLNYRLF